jgi:parallel beta-helix repeat protein
MKNRAFTKIIQKKIAIGLLLMFLTSSIFPNITAYENVVPLASEEDSVSIIGITRVENTEHYPDYFNQEPKVYQKERTGFKGENKISMIYQFSEPVLTEIIVSNTSYTQISIENAPSDGNLGAPSLPTYGANILLPPGREVKNILVNGMRSTSHSIPYQVNPAGEPVPFSQIEQTQPPVPDSTVYSLHTPYPPTLYTNSNIQCFRGYQILVLTLNPVQYVPAQNTLISYTQLEVTVELTEEKGPSNQLYRGGVETDTQEAINKVNNPEMVAAYPIEKDFLPDEYVMLILTTDELKDGFIPLKNAHDAKGQPTVIKTLTDVGSNDPAAIRTFIKNEYVNHNISYVLLGGDYDSIPSRCLFVERRFGDGNPSNMPSDMYYECLDGSYNYDGDARWGEPTDGERGREVDLWADVYVGRACVDNLTEVGYFVGKTIAYLRDTNQTYRDSILLAGEWAGFGGEADFGDYFVEQMIDECDDVYYSAGIPSQMYTIQKLYDHDWPTYTFDNPRLSGWQPSDMISHINQGVLIISHAGHGTNNHALKLYEPVINWRGVIGGPCHHVVENLTNTHYCFIYSYACYSGAFDNKTYDGHTYDNPTPYECIAEYFTGKAPHGAFAAIMSARMSLVGMGDYEGILDGPCQRYQRMFWDAIFRLPLTPDGSIPSVPSISKANTASKTAWIYMINSLGMRWQCYGLNFFGDPLLTLVPNHNVGLKKLTTPDHIPFSSSAVPVTVTLANNGFTDEGNIQVTLQVNGEDQQTICIPFFARFTVQVLTFSYKPPGPGIYKITVTTSIPYVTEDFTDDNEKSISITVGVVNNDTQECFDTIQHAINTATNGHHLLVPPGVYNEHVIINKEISLLGADQKTTIIDGDKEDFVLSINADHVLVSGFTLQHGDIGVYVESSHDIIISNNTISNNLIESEPDSFVISRFPVSETRTKGCGITIEKSTNVQIVDNDLCWNTYGIQIRKANTNIWIYHNNFYYNNINAIDGGKGGIYWDKGYPAGGNYWRSYTGKDELCGSAQDKLGYDSIGDIPYYISSRKSCDRYPLQYPFGVVVINLNTTHDFQRIKDAIDDPSTRDGHIILAKNHVYSENVVINKTIQLIGEDKYRTVLNGGYKEGLRSTVLVTADHVTIQGVTIQHDKCNEDYFCIGIQIDSNYTTVKNTIIKNNYIGLQGGNLGVITNNIFTNNQWYGIDPVDNEMISENLFTFNDIGLHLRESSNNSIVHNSIRKDSCGIILEGGSSVYRGVNNNIIDGNLIIDNSYYGICLSGVYGFCMSNYICHNTFINNTHHVFEDADSLNNNQWDDGYPSGGNYWADYTGDDLFSGPGQNITGCDGIGDIHYGIPDYSGVVCNADRYPLMTPPVPVVCIQVPSSGFIGKQMFFQGFVSGGVPSYTFRWDFADGTYSFEQNLYHCYNQVGLYDVMLTVTDNQGLAVFYDSTTVAIIETPIIAFAHGPYTDIVSIPIQFIGSAVGGIPPYSWSWNLGDGSAILHEQNPCHIYDQPGVYTIMLTVTDESGFFLYTDTTTAIIKTSKCR